MENELELYLDVKESIDNIIEKLEDLSIDEQIDYIAKSCNINIPYVETWKRD